MAGDAELVREIVHPGQLPVPVGAARATDHEEQRLGIAQLGEGAHREADTLQRLDAPREQQHPPAVETEIVLGGAASVGKNTE